MRRSFTLFSVVVHAIVISAALISRKCSQSGDSHAAPAADVRRVSRHARRHTAAGATAARGDGTNGKPDRLTRRRADRGAKRRHR